MHNAELFSTIGFAAPMIALAFALIGWKKNWANTIFQSVLIIGSGFGLIDSVAHMIQGGASLSHFFLAILNIGVILASLFAISYLPKYDKQYDLCSLHVASAFFIFGMQGVLFSGTILTFLLFWEIMSIAAFFLVIADHESASVKAGLLYMIMTQIGFFALLAGFGIISGGQYAIPWSALREHVLTLSPVAKAVAFLLLFCGFGGKAGLLPFHQWLPYAHPQAPSNSSALMSGTMLNVAVYGFVQTAFTVFYPVPKALAGLVILVGLVSAVYGVLCAITETDVKKVLAWSSVENMGLIFSALGFSLWFGQNEPAFALAVLVAALFHVVNHSVFKIGWFLCAGAIISETHTRNMDEMGGLANLFPALSVIAMGMVFAGSALPPFGTFYGEWQYVQTLGISLLHASAEGSLMVILAIGAIGFVGGGVVMAFVRMFSAIFLSRYRGEHAPTKKRLPRLMILPIGATAILSLAVGLCAGTFQNIFRNVAATVIDISNYPAVYAGNSVTILPNDSSFSFNPVNIAGLLLASLIVSYGICSLKKRKTARMTDTWNCGQPIHARMTTTATGFCAPIRFFFRMILLPYKKYTRVPVVATNQWIARRVLEAGTESFFEKYVYHPIVAVIGDVSGRVKRLQSGAIQWYILFMFLTLILVLFVAL